MGDELALQFVPNENRQLNQTRKKKWCKLKANSTNYYLRFIKTLFYNTGFVAIFRLPHGPARR